MAQEENDLMKITKTKIRSVVMSVKEGVPAHKFNRDYLDFLGENVPFKELGFPSLPIFMKAIPDVVSIEVIQGTELYKAVADVTTEHLQNLIQRQKSNPKKSKAFRKGPPTRYPKVHSQGSRNPISFGGGWFKPGPRPFNNSSRSRSFGRYQPDRGPPGAVPFRAQSPILSTPFGSPLTVTIRQTSAEDGERERVIERRDGGGGRFMAQKALKDVVGQRQQDKKGLNSYYELPPRFQKRFNAGTTNGAGAAPANARPVAEEKAEPTVPSKVRQWTAQVLTTFPQGLWSTLFYTLYTKEFGQEPPPNLINVVQTWTDIATVELNAVANRYVIYPLSDRDRIATAVKAVRQETTATTAEVNNTHTELQEKPPPAATRRPWKNFIVPVAILFKEDEEAKVYASNSTDLGDFYMQRADSRADEITDMLFETEQEVAIPNLSDLQPGVFCGALYSMDDSWYRARVLYVKDETEIGIIFIDYGNRETVPVHNVRCLTEETARIPAQAVNCSMFGIKPFEGQKGWSDAAKSKFHSMMDETEMNCTTLSIENGSCVVELWAEGSDISLNEQLYWAKLVDTSLTHLDPPDLSLPETGYLEVVVAFVDLHHCWLRIIGKEFSEALETLEDRLVELYQEGQRQPSRRLQEDNVCIAHCNLLYHRVKIKKIHQDQANCLFVDHGYMEWVPLDQLVPLAKDINQSLPYQAVWCGLMGLEIYMSNPITMTELVERSKNKICVAEVIVSDPLKVMLYDTHGADDININEEIARRLVAEGHVLDLALFRPLEDSPSESSRASSPRPPVTSQRVPGEEAAMVPSEPSLVPGSSSSSSTATTTIEQLESGAEALTLNAVVVAGRENGTSERAAMNGGLTTNASGSAVATNATGSTDLTVLPPPPPPTSEQTSAPSSSSSSMTVMPAGSQQCVGVGVVGLGGDSSSSTALEQSPQVAVAAALSPHGDSLNVSYDTWPLPGYATLPEVGVFFPAFVQSVEDPSNFVIVPHTVTANLNDLMMQMNTRFSLDFNKGDKSSVQTPTVVPLPQPHHLYMAVYNGTFYRAIYMESAEHLYHMLLTDYCYHVLVSKEEIFFLPKPFWSLPFAAFRAALFGIKPAAGLWRESPKYQFTVRALGKTLMAVIKCVRAVGAQGTEETEVARRSTQRLVVHLVDTSDPDTDVVISDLLLCSSDVKAAA